MDTTTIKNIEVQHINSSVDGRDYYEIVADGEVVADVSNDHGVPRIVIFRTTRNLDLDTNQFVAALQRAVSELSALAG